MAFRPDIKKLLRACAQRRKATIVLSTGEQFDMYFDPLTEAEDDRLREMAEKGIGHYSFNLLISKAQHQDGTPMFTMADMGQMRQEFPREDLAKMIVALLNNGGILVGQDSKSDSESP